MKLETVTPPATEPLSYSEAREHIRVDQPEERDYVLRLITSARMYCENYTNRSLISRTLKATWYRDGIDKPGQLLALPAGSVLSIMNVKDEDGNTVDPSNYDLRRIGTTDYLYLKQQIWPLSCTYVAGYGAASTDIPEDLRFGMLQHIGHLYTNREPVSERQQSIVAHGMEAIYQEYRYGYQGAE